MYFKARKSTRIQTSRIGGAVEGHGQEGRILWHTSEAWDGKEATRAIKDEEID